MDTYRPAGGDPADRRFMDTQRCSDIRMQDDSDRDLCEMRWSLHRCRRQGADGIGVSFSIVAASNLQHSEDAIEERDNEPDHGERDNGRNNTDNELNYRRYEFNHAVQDRPDRGVDVHFRSDRTSQGEPGCSEASELYLGACPERTRFIGNHFSFHERR